MEEINSLLKNELTKKIVIGGNIMVYADSNQKSFLLKEPEHAFISGLRIIMGFIWLWAFLDKLLGLGFSTSPQKSWLAGNSPTAGFLKFGTNPNSPFASLYAELAKYSTLLDPFYMAMLLFVGITLLTGVMVRFGSIAGIVFVISIYFSLIPLANNPIIDEHIIYAVIFLMFIFTNAGLYGWSLGKKYQELEVVKKYPILK